MAKDGLVEGMQLNEEEDEDFFGESCQFGKQHKLPFNKEASTDRHQLRGMFHSDVCGPMSVQSLGDERYFVLFKDDASGYRRVSFIRHKSDVFDKFKDFQKMITNKFGHSMKVLRADNGREYGSKEFRRYLASKGILLESTILYMPQQNGKSKRDNRTLVESARLMLKAKQLSISLCAEAVNTITYILNQIPYSQTKSTTPYEIWTGSKPDLSHARIFGSEAFVHVPKELRDKLDAKAKRMLLVGYKGTKGVSEARDVIFNEKKTCLIVPVPVLEVIWPGISTMEDEEKGPNEVQDEPEVIAARSPHRDDVSDEERRKSLPTQRKQHHLQNRESLKPPSRYQANIAEWDVPSSFQEGVTGEHAEKWPGLDYNETFSPKVRYNSLRILLVLFAYQFDVKTVFLNGGLKEDIFMKIPEAVDVGSDSKESFNLSESEADKSMFCGKVKGHDVYLVLFVDNGIVTIKSTDSLNCVIQALRSTYDITLGDTSMFADPHSHLQPAEGEGDCKLNVRFREAIGSLMFLPVVSRLDIAFTVNVVSRYLSSHNNSHWEAVKRIIRYLKGSRNVGIKYRYGETVFKLVEYSDADFASDIETRRSTTGYVFTLARGPVTWSSQRQKLV
ncbi:hypothetical protein KM043_017093 [Ampulex compressa]|nr:hypothetical protein KM043_017093 [Ampulex compressa]